MHLPFRTRFLAPWLLASLLAGCSAGPDFRPAAPPPDAGYAPGPLLLRTASAEHTLLGEAQQVDAGMELGAPWWQQLGSAPLNALVAQALQASPTLVAAQATLRQAEESQAAQTGALQLPRVDASAGSQRQRTSPSAQGQAGDGRTFNLHNAGVGVRYQLDLAGGNRRALEALAARTDYRRYELEGARLALAASIVRAAVTQAQQAAQLDALAATVASQDGQLQLTRQRLALGQATQGDVLALQAQVEQARAGLPPLHKQHQHSAHLLALLAGQSPAAPGLPAFTLQDFTLPAQLPLLIPSELVRQRPDVQAAQALVHAANADYGVAVARLYPQINLSANLGAQALSAGALFGSGSAVWGLVGQITQPLFNPALPAERRAALAALDAATAHYQGVVLEALRSVADALRALEHDAETLAALARADAAAQSSLRQVQQQVALGAASHLQLLVAEQQAHSSRTPLAAAQAQRLLGSAALYQAVGAGWAGVPEELSKQ